MPGPRSQPQPPSQPTAELPDRPLLSPYTPVLRRGSSQLQVGLEPYAVLVHRRSAERLLERLDGQTDLATLRTLGREARMSPTEVDDLVRGLHAAGLLEPGRGSTPGATAVRLIGLGPLGQQVARLLLTAGLHVYAADDDRRTDRRSGLSPADLADLPRPRGARLTHTAHWSKPERATLALTVVATEGVEPDRVMADALLRADQPHLVVRTAGSSATVGPLVLPGRTACLRCTDLTRRDADPGWPVLLHQLVGLRLPTSAVLVAWAAGLGAAQVLAHLQGQLPESAGATVELDRGDHLMRWRRWPVHPSCGCAWGPTTEWGP